MAWGAVGEGAQWGSEGVGGASGPDCTCQTIWGGKLREQSLIETFPRECVAVGALWLPVNPSLTAGLWRNQEVTDNQTSCNCVLKVLYCTDFNLIVFQPTPASQSKVHPSLLSITPLFL